MKFHTGLLALLPLVLAKPSTDKLETKVEKIKSAMLASIRTSWEQGVAADSLAELDFPEYSVYGSGESNTQPTAYPLRASANKRFPLQVIQFALSAAVRQSADGRLSQIINGDADGAALDGASAGLAVLIGKYNDNSYSDYLGQAAEKQLNYVLKTAPRTSTGAISHRAATRDYWNDAVYVGFPFIAAYGAATANQTLLQIAYDQCRLYRDALRLPGPGLWAHIYSDDRKKFDDKGLWATGNAWAAKGMLNVAVLVEKSGQNMTTQVSDLKGWVKEILNGTFTRLDSDNLVPNYMDNTGRGDNSDTFGDAAASALLAATAYRAAHRWPADFGKFYTDGANKINESVMSKITDLGLLSPIVDPLSWNVKGVLGTEAQAFGLMMYAGWKDWKNSGKA
ncbi:glycoside hydrolase family protein [Rhizoctonia solani AG-3 Rhs1AP]|uniref:Glycoside hydrolase family protein n=1 Tax=Rhizoctonia solani AG-3 Rhs1AP TaxID=1086054 RepID=X8J0X5_9AGAM|nr:glycoside hydrolase family protein [Rhizoctonia solani AG-3 Rhs1AP]